MNREGVVPEGNQTIITLMQQKTGQEKKKITKCFPIYHLNLTYLEGYSLTSFYLARA